MSPVLRGIFLTSDDPNRAAAFYRDVAGLELERIGNADYSYWKIDKDGLQLAIHDARLFASYTHPPFPESNLTHLYFKIESQKNFLEHLESLEIAPYSVDDIVVTVSEPDGRKVLFGTA
jgi:hypothetical protein